MKTEPPYFFAMIINIRKLFAASVMTFAAFLFLTACAPGDAREWLIAPGWSRAPVVAHTQMGDPASLTVDDEGQIYLLLSTAVDNNTNPQIIAFDCELKPVWEQTLPFPLARPDEPRIVWDGTAVNALWLSDQSLYLTQFNTIGEITLPPTKISGDAIVGSFDTAVSPSDQLTIWFSGPRREPGLYALPSGNPLGKAALIVPNATRPTIVYDQSGELHASWTTYPAGFGSTRFYYALYLSEADWGDSPDTIYEANLSPTDILDGPILGIDEEQAYIFWTISIRTGPSAGTVISRYIHFPLGQAESSAAPQRLFAPVILDLPHEFTPQDGLLAGARVQDEAEGLPMTSIVQNINLNPNQEQELAIAFETRVQYQFRKMQEQVGLRFFQGGGTSGYQLLSFTSKPSRNPALVSDGEGYLYVTWLERGEGSGFDVYLASTAPDIEEANSKLTRGDMGRLLREFSFGLLSGAVLSPILVLVWLIIPFLVLALTSFMRKEGRGVITTIGTAVSFSLAIAAYWAVKMGILPDMKTYIPFSAWIPAIPSWMQPILQFGVPFLIMITGLFVAWHFTFRRKSRSALYFMGIYGAVDGVLTLAVYGFLIYNAF